MTEQFKDQISALMDGELDRHESRFALRRLESDADSRAQWQRLHVARACLRSQHVAIRPGFADAVAAAIAGDVQLRANTGGALLRWAGGFAVAASVAVAALLLVPGTNVPSTQPNAPLAVAPAPAASPPVGEVVSSGLRESDLRPDLAPAVRTVAAPLGRVLSPSLRLDPQIDAYLVRHSTAAAHPWQASFAPLIPVSVNQPDVPAQVKNPNQP